MKVLLLAGVVLVVSLGLWNGCLGRKAHTDVEAVAVSPAGVTSIHVESGAAIRVALSSRVSAQTARPGDAWEGRVAEEAVLLRAVTRRSGLGTKTWVGSTVDPVVVLDKVVIPAGSHVTGVVTAAPEDASGPGAVPVLAVNAIEFMGRTLSISASAGQVVGGSPRARGHGASAGRPDAIVLRFTVNEIVDLQ